MNCRAYGRVKLLEHGMKIVERVLERRIRALIKLDEMQCGFMPGKGTDALFILQRTQEEYHDKRKLFCAMWVWRRHLIESRER